MIETKELRKGEFWLYCPKSNVFDDKLGKEVVWVAVPLLDENVNITIDLQNIPSISGKGFNALHELIKEAESKMSKVYFANIHHDMDELIQNLTLSSDG